LGFFARMCPEKGLDTLVEAYLLLVQRGRVGRLKLRVGGSCGPADAAFVDSLRERLQAGLEIAFDAKFLDDRRQPKRNPVQTDHQRETNAAQRVHFSAFKSVHRSDLVFIAIFDLHVFGQHGFFLGIQPFGLGDVAVQVKENTNADHNGGNSLSQE